MGRGGQEVSNLMTLPFNFNISAVQLPNYPNVELNKAFHANSKKTQLKTGRKIFGYD